MSMIPDSSPISPTGQIIADGESAGLWLALRARDAWHGRRRPALFLDRDGVLNIDHGYVHRLDDLDMIPGAAALIGAANSRDIAVIVVTNQSGIGRGYFDWADFVALQSEIERRLAVDGAIIDATLACPFHPDAQPPFDIADHPGRKPRPGMLLCGAETLDIDLASSWIVGDRPRDMEAGARAELRGGILIGGEDQYGIFSDFDVRSVRTTADALTALPLLNPA